MKIFQPWRLLAISLSIVLTLLVTNLDVVLADNGTSPVPPSPSHSSGWNGYIMGAELYGLTLIY